MHRKDFTILRQIGNRTVQKLMMRGRQRIAYQRKLSECSTELDEHLPSMRRVEQVDHLHILPQGEWYFDLLHETTERHPEVVANQQDTLDPIAVALPQRIEQLRVGAAVHLVEPLLELIDNNQQLSNP